MPNPDRADGRGGHRLTLLPDGPERLEALIALIDGAQESLRVLYYIWVDDESGRRVRDALVAAAERGVAGLAARRRLRLLGTPRRASSGRWSRPQARFCRFVPRWGRRYLLRNHQKLALADGHKAIVGGFNISNDYFGTIEAGRLARSRARGGGPERRMPRPLFRRAVRLGRDAGRLDPAAAADAVPEQRARRAAPMAVRRADAAAQPLGALGQERHDEGAAGRHHLRLFRAEPVDDAPALRSRRARRGRGSSRRPSSTINGRSARRASSTGGC